MVQTVRHLLKQSTDPYLALLIYRATPLLGCNLSPAELSMGSHLRTLVPQTDVLLIPQWTYLDNFQKRNRIEKASQIKHYNAAHCVKTHPDIPDNPPVWITTEGGPVEGIVVSQADRPRSYVVETPTGRVERNRYNIRVKPSATEGNELDQLNQPQDSSEQSSPGVRLNPTFDTTPKRILTRSQTGTAIHNPDYYRPS